VIRDFVILFVHLLVTIVSVVGPGGTRSVVAESLLTKHQLLIVNRSRTRAPRLRPSDRIIIRICAILMRPTRLLRSVIILKPSTVLSFHRALVSRKYHLLFTAKNRRKPGPLGPSPELIAIIVEMKNRNPRFGYQRIADQILLVFDINVDKDGVRRVLAQHYRPQGGSSGPSWLTFLAHSKDSLWSCLPLSM
jgi:putative transposase